MKVGSKVPDFSLTDKDGVVTNLSGLDADFVVLYFYPKDDTPGCTIEGIEFTAELPQFKKIGARVIGISGGDDKSKAKFCAKHKLKVTLLSDPDFSVANAYGSFGEKTFMGRKFNGILRKTFVINKKRELVKEFDSVKAQGHAAEVLAFLQTGNTAEVAKAPTERVTKASQKVKKAKRGVPAKRA